MNQSRMVAPDPNLGQLVDQMEHVLSAEIDAYFRDYRSRKIERKLNLYHFAELLGHGIKAIEETETKLAKMKEILDIVAQGEKKIS